MGNCGSSPAPKKQGRTLSSTAKAKQGGDPSPFANEKAYSLRTEHAAPGPTPSDAQLTANELRDRPYSSQGVLSPCTLKNAKTAESDFRNQEPAEAPVPEAPVPEAPVPEAPAEAVEMPQEVEVVEEEVKVAETRNAEDVPERTEQKRAALDAFGDQLLSDGWVRTGTQGESINIPRKGSS